MNKGTPLEYLTMELELGPNTKEVNFYMSNRPDMASHVMASYDCNIVKRNLKNKGR